MNWRSPSVLNLLSAEQEQSRGHLDDIKKYKYTSGISNLDEKMMTV